MAARGEFSRLSPSGKPARAKLELTEGTKALLGVDTAFLIITMLCAIAILVLVVLIYTDDTCDDIKHDLHDLKHQLRNCCGGDDDCAMLGEDCKRTSDCCKDTGSKLVCSSGTCQAVVTSASSSSKH